MLESQLSEMTDGMQNGKAGSSLELRLFSSCLNTKRFQDRRSLERKKEKKPNISFSKAHLACCVGTTNTAWEKTKIPRGADNVV